MIRHAGEEAARQLAACMLRVSLTPSQFMWAMLFSLIVGIVVGGLAATIISDIRTRRAMRG